MRQARARLGLTGAMKLADVGGGQFAAAPAKIRARAFNMPFATTVDGRGWSGRVVPVQLGGEPLYLAFACPTTNCWPMRTGCCAEA